MPYKVGDYVVCPAFGVGRISGVVDKAFMQADSRQYYEVTGERSTTWVPVHDAAQQGVRLVTRRADLAGYRAVLGSQPVELNPEYRQRHIDVRAHLRGDSMLALCEVVRDLNGRGWLKPLGESDARALQTIADTLHREWAVADGVSLAAAANEVNTLLLEARRAHQNQRAQGVAHGDGLT